MRAFSGLVLLLAVVGLIFFAATFAERDDVAAPPPAPAPQEDEEIGGEPLPAASEFDEEVWVTIPPEVGPQTGTAFTLDEGVWMTARHVVDGCPRVGVVVQGDAGVLVTDIRPSETADVAVFRAPLERAPLAADLDEAFALGEPAFMIGYPQGVPGEVAGLLLGRETMKIRGRYSTNEPVIAWAETTRTQGLSGTLGGLSGGPAFDADGQVVGVVVAEAPRRGRIYTAAPSSLLTALNAAEAAVDAAATPAAAALSAETYGVEGRRLRRDLRIAKVQCVAE